MEKQETWKTMNLKTKIALISAIVAFCIGWGLTIAGFIIGAGVISDSVLWVLGQSLIYAASIFGAGMYIGSEMKSMRKEIKDFMKDGKKDKYDYDSDDNF